MLPVLLALLVAAAFARAGEIELSDGNVYRGRVHLTGKRGFVLTAGKRKYRIPVADVARLEMRVVSQSMERPFTFKNPGDPTRTYGEGTYPLRNLECTITLHDGRTLAGKLISTVLWLEPADGDGEDEEIRFKLVRQLKGEVGQTQDDLVHVRAVRFGAPAAGFEPGSILGRLALPDPLDDVVAVRRGDNLVFRGRVREDGRFEVRGLPAGTYDVFLQTEREFLHPFGPNEARDAVAQATRHAPDFFEQRRVDALDGGPAAARSLTFKLRRGRTSYEQELHGDRLWRLELWLWHRLDSEWRLDRRVYLFRGRKAEDQALRTARRVAALGGVAVAAGRERTIGDAN